MSIYVHIDKERGVLHKVHGSQVYVINFYSPKSPAFRIVSKYLKTWKYIWS